MTRVRPAEVRFYIDADVLGLAKVLAGLRIDVTYPGDPGIQIRKRVRPACPVTSPRAKDTEWLPVVAKHGWLIITRDRRIQDHKAEIGEVRQHGARMVVLSGPDARATFEQLEIVMCQWRRIETLLTVPGPLLYTATRTSLERVPLSPRDGASNP